MSKKVINTIDLFCGCGGLSYGFEKAGFSIILGIDNDKTALETFRINHKGSKGENIDLFDDDYLKRIKESVSNSDIDIVIGGPPCQGFSLTGTRNFDDKRNTLYLRMFEIVRNFKPKAFVLENVPGMATLYGGQVKDEIIRRYTEIGYNVTAQVVVAADYGVPQLRKRLVFVGLQQKYGVFEFPKPTHNEENYVTCEEAISDLPSLENEIGSDEHEYTNNPESNYQNRMRNGSNKLFNHLATVHSKKVVDVIKLVPDGGNHKSLPKGIGEHRKFNEAWTRYSSKKPSKTIDTGHRNHFHYKYNRIPTVRENARLQSFPDTFKFVGTKTSQYRQVGNAVPPLMAEVIANKIKEYI